MNKRRQPYVIAISGVSGAGKTVIVKGLNERLHNSKALFFDDYDFEGPDNIVEWVDRGADYDEWDLTPLIRDIKALLVEPLDFIVLDFPFAYKHYQSSKLIDLTVFIETPLDMAMARRMIRDFQNNSAENILKELEDYLLQGRRGYLEMLETIKPNSDITVDGAKSVPEIIDKIYERILSK